MNQLVHKVLSVCVLLRCVQHQRCLSVDFEHFNMQPNRLSRFCYRQSLSCFYVQYTMQITPKPRRERKRRSVLYWTKIYANAHKNKLLLDGHVFSLAREIDFRLPFASISGSLYQKILFMFLCGYNMSLQYTVKLSPTPTLISKHTNMNRIFWYKLPLMLAKGRQKLISFLCAFAISV